MRSVENKSQLICILLLTVTFITIITALTTRKFGNINNSYSFSRFFYTGEHVRLTAVIDNSKIDLTSGGDYGNSIALASNKRLILDSYKTGNDSTYAFYIKDSNGDITNLISLPADNYSNNLERKMAYSGIFRKYGEYITYSFAHFPWIYIFSFNGPLITIIHTKDDIPHPSIIRYKNYYLYERGKTHNSNLFSCVKSDIVFVLSYRVPSNHNGFLLDRYSLSSGQYLSSIDVPGPDKTGNQDITCVWSMSDTICIKARGKLWLMQIG